MNARTVVFTAAGGLAVALGAYALAATPGANNEISACYDKKGGNQGEVRLLIKGKCSKAEKAIAWGVEGPPGPAGAPGASQGFYVQRASALDLVPVPQDTFTPAVTLSQLPAGKYVITGFGSPSKRSGATLIRCRINATGQTGPSSTVQVGEVAAATFITSLSVSLAVDSQAPFSAVFECLKSSTANPDQNTFVEAPHMNAVRVDALDSRVAP